MNEFPPNFHSVTNPLGNRRVCSGYCKKISVQGLTKPIGYAIMDTTRGISAAGSASHWQCGGQGFESPMLHPNRSPETAVIRRFRTFFFVKNGASHLLATYFGILAYVLPQDLCGSFVIRRSDRRLLLPQFRGRLLRMGAAAEELGEL